MKMKLQTKSNHDKQISDDNPLHPLNESWNTHAQTFEDQSNISTESVSNSRLSGLGLVWRRLLAGYMSRCLCEFDISISPIIRAASPFAGPFAEMMHSMVL